MSLYLGDEDAESIASLLSECEAKGDLILTRKALQKAITLSAGDTNLEKCFLPVIKMMSNPDLIIKKLVYTFLSIYATKPENQELFLLSICSFTRDCQDPSPMIRGLALRTLSNLPNASFTEYWVPSVLRGLQDSSSYVRRVAVLACIKLYYISPELLGENGITDQLYALLRDPDPIVLANAIIALEEILQEEGGMVVNKNIHRYLLSKLQTLTEFGLVICLPVLHRYNPGTEEAIIEVMNIIDPFLKHNSPSVVIRTLEYFLRLVESMPHLRDEVYFRAKNQILNFLTVGNSELTSVLLDYIEEMVLKEKDLMKDHYQSLYCKYKEPSYVKVKRIQILCKIIHEDNSKDIIDELSMCSSDSSWDVAMAATEALGTLAESRQNYPQIIQKLLKNLRSESPDIVVLTLQVLQKLDHYQNETIDTLIQLTHEAVDKISGDDNGVVAILWIISEYGTNYEETPYVIECFIEDTDDILKKSSNYLLSILTATTKVFFSRPSECQDMLGQILEVCLNCNCEDVKERAKFYYKIIKQDITLAKRIICDT